MKSEKRNVWQQGVVPHCRIRWGPSLLQGGLTLKARLGTERKKQTTNKQILTLGKLGKETGGQRKDGSGGSDCRPWGTLGKSGGRWLFRGKDGEKGARHGPRKTS